VGGGATPRALIANQLACSASGRATSPPSLASTPRSCVQQTKPYTCTCTRAARPQVVEWEATLHPECLSGLKLLRFRGRPDEPTPKARALSLMGYSSPFDRHDWVVTRCGKEVTYLIDFYNGSSARAGKPVAMHIDARPAADDAQGMWDRVRMPFASMWRGASGGTDK
jgi:hypothetical protein